MDNVELDPAIRSYYDEGRERDRLGREDHPSGPLEFVRTRELIERHIPGRKLDILDVGGGPGAYALWLTSLGHNVKLIDPVPPHVDQARAQALSADIGNARSLELVDSSVDVVLLMGPLYHLVRREDRLAALSEARRVLRPGGVVFAAAISRFAALLDFLVRRDRLHEPEVFNYVARCVTTGALGSDGSGIFTIAYAHRPEELRSEVLAEGFEIRGFYNVEGPGFLVPNFAERWGDPARRTAILEAARLTESDPDLLAAASHLLIVATPATY